MPVILALKKLRQEDHREFEASFIQDQQNRTNPLYVVLIYTYLPVGLYNILFFKDKSIVASYISSLEIKISFVIKKSLMNSPYAYSNSCNAL